MSVIWLQTLRRSFASSWHQYVFGHVVENSSPQPYGLLRDVCIKCNDNMLSQKLCESIKRRGTAHTWVSRRICGWGCLLEAMASIRSANMADGYTGNVQSSFKFQLQMQAAIDLCDGAEFKERCCGAKLLSDATVCLRLRSVRLYQINQLENYFPYSTWW